MKLPIVFACLLCSLFVSCEQCPPCSQPKELCISAPSENEGLPTEVFVCGMVSDPSATVWVVVHPMSISTYIVQQAVSVKEDGRWKVKVYLGDHRQHMGEHFEIMAFANPKGPALAVGEKRGSWPEAQWRSQVVEVIKTKP